ncbi:hypothetical protein BDV11DRAFT_74937 [Aspergillus similis]
MFVNFLSSLLFPFLLSSLSALFVPVLAFHYTGFSASEDNTAGSVGMAVQIFALFVLPYFSCFSLRFREYLPAYLLFSILLPYHE